MKYDREKAREQLMRRTQESIKNKDKGQFGSLFTIEVPMWKCESGPHKIDILPFVAGRNIGLFTEGAQPGELCYVLEAYVHYGMGPNEEPFLCLYKTFGKRCPGCETYKALLDAEDDDADDYKPRRRVFYNILCHDSRDELRKGVQVWDVAHFFMEHHLLTLAENDPKTGEVVYFSDPLNGKQIYFKRSGSGIGTKFGAHSFIDRDYDIPDSVLDNTYQLDEIIRIPTYDEFYKKINVGASPPTSSREVLSAGTAREDIPAELDRTPEETGGGLLLRKRNDALAEAGTAAPQRKQKKEEEVVLACPVHGRFGFDFSELVACDGCSIYDACGDECDRIKRATAAAEPQLPARKQKEEEEPMLPKKKGRK